MMSFMARMIYNYYLRIQMHSTVTGRERLIARAPALVQDQVHAEHDEHMHDEHGDCASCQVMRELFDASNE